MPAATTEKAQRPQSAYAGLDFIKAAFCPLEFTAMKLGQHPEFKQFVYAYPATLAIAAHAAPATAVSTTKAGG